MTTKMLRSWYAYSEEKEIDKKEPVETFDWDPLPMCNRKEMKDLCVALDAVEGSRDWLKNVVYKKKGRTFEGEMENKIVAALPRDAHSGASWSCLLGTYKNCLRDWDLFVSRTKRLGARREYLAGVAEGSSVLASVLHSLCMQWDVAKKEVREIKYGAGSSTPLESASPLEAAMTKVEALDTEIRKRAGEYNVSFRTIPEYKALFQEIEEGLSLLGKEIDHERREEQHREMIGSLEFLYEVPFRWLDTPNGCSLQPGNPNHVPARAIAEMEKMYPGYTEHLDCVKKALAWFARWSQRQQYEASRESIEIILDAHGVVAGKII
jgi:hypothetical protein